MPDNRPCAQEPRMSFMRGSLVPRTAFFTIEDLPSRAQRNKSSLIPSTLDQRWQQAKANASRWEKDEELLRITQINFVYNSEDFFNS